MKAALVLFLFPFPEFKYLLPDAVLEWNPINAAGGGYLMEENTFTGINNQYSGWPAAIVGWIYIIVSGIIIVCSVFIHMKSYFRVKGIYRQSSSLFDVRSYLECYEEIKKEIGLRRTVRFAFSGCCSSPLTIGIFSPVILVPRSAKNYSAEEWDILIRHELNHIKSHDLLVKFIAQAARDIHWFNPAAHLLYAELCNMCEIYCDARAVKSYGKDMRDRYCRCMIDWAEDTEPKRVPIPLGFTGNMSAKIIKRRVLEMKHTKQRKKFITLLTGVIIGLVGTTSVLAYEPANQVDVLQDLNQDRNYFVTEENGEASTTNDLNTGDVFVDNDGNIYEITGNSERVLCFHNYVDVTIGEHISNSDGSCITLYYDADRCTRCGTIKNMVINGDSEIHNKCPH